MTISGKEKLVHQNFSWFLEWLNCQKKQINSVLKRFIDLKRVR
jgi:hypothetical protein